MNDSYQYTVSAKPDALERSRTAFHPAYGIAGVREKTPGKHTHTHTHYTLIIANIC